MNENERIPGALRNMIDKGGFKNPVLISEQKRKGRFCLSAEAADGTKVFLKWNLPEKTEHYQAFSREKKVYLAAAESGTVPRAIPSDTDLLVTELMAETGTLRSLLLDPAKQKLWYESVCRAFSVYRGFLGAIEEHEAELSGSCLTYELSKQYDRHLRQLYTSGPCDAKVHRVERRINQLRLKLERRHGAPVGENAKKCLMHGDLHLNNFMLTSGGGKERDGLLLIDFEDVSYGSREIELAYLMAQLSAMFKGQRELKECCIREFHRVFDPEIDVSLYETIYSKYIKAVKHNSRFHR